MAPKKPTMLQRQRALRKQQQQTKQQSSKQLPPKGQTSANTRQARGQRISTAKAQAANQQRVIARGMEGFVRRGKAMDKLDKAAKGTKGSGTRIAGAGGGLAKRQSSTVTTRQSGKPATTGGRVQQSSGGSASSNRVQQVRVRDLGSTKPNQMGGRTARALPPGRTGGALARTARGAANVAKGAGMAGRVAGAFGTALAIPAAIKNIKDVAERNKRWDAYKERMGMNQKPNSTNRRGQGSGNKPRSNDMPSKPNWRDKVSSSNVDQLRQGQNATTRSYADKTPAKPPTPPRRNPAPAADQRRSGGGNNTAPRSQTPPKPRFTGTVDEGRKMWAEKYSSSKYDGQAIQKEAKKLLDEMKKRREDKSNAQRAGWDGNKNY